MKKNKRIRKIVLCGATIGEGTNFGDVLLEELIEEKIKRVIPDVNISKFTKNETIKNYLWKIIKTDAFIYVPGGYLGYIEKWYSGSLNKSWQRFKYYYFPGLIYSLTKKPMAMIGQGIGPYEYKLLSYALKVISNSSSIVSVRDIESYELLRNVGCNGKIDITSDCSQILLDCDLIWESAESVKIKKKLGGLKKIFVLFFNTKEWKEKILLALEPLMEDENYGFVISTDVVNMDRKDFIEFVEKFPKQRTVEFDYRNPQQLLSAYKEIDIVVTPKLHTGIVGCVMNKSVFAFAVQYDKTKIYYKRIGYPERVYNLNTISPKKMRSIIKKYENEKINIPKSIIEEANKNYELLEKFLKKGNV